MLDLEGTTGILHLKYKPFDLTEEEWKELIRIDEEEI